MNIKNELNKRIFKKPITGSLPFKDRDGDKLIDFVDCVPSNKNKQGFIDYLAHKTKQKISSKIENKLPSYKEYKQNEEEYRRVKLEKYKEEKEYLKGKREYLEEKERVKQKSKLRNLLKTDGKMKRGFETGGFYSSNYYKR